MIDFNVRCVKRDAMGSESFIGITELTQEFGVTTRTLRLSLDEIAEIIDLYDETSGPQKQIDKLLERIEARRQALLAQRQDIDDALRELATVEQKALAHLETLKVGAS